MSAYVNTLEEAKSVKWKERSSSMGLCRSSSFRPWFKSLGYLAQEGTKISYKRCQNCLNLSLGCITFSTHRNLGQYSCGQDYQHAQNPPPIHRASTLASCATQQPHVELRTIRPRGSRANHQTHRAAHKGLGAWCPSTAMDRDYNFYYLTVCQDCTPGTASRSSPPAPISGRLPGTPRSSSSEANLLSDPRWNTGGSEELLCWQSRHQ